MATEPGQKKKKKSKQRNESTVKETFTFMCVSGERPKSLMSP